MSDTPYIPFTHLPTEVTEAAETLHVFFEKQGMREWQYSHVADRRLVNKLERELNAAKAALSGRTVSCSACNAMAEEIAAMKKAIPTNTP